MTDWIFPCNPNKFNIIEAFNNLNRLNWTQPIKDIEVGSLVYIYVSSPFRAIKYKCRVNKTNLSKREIDTTEYVIDRDAFKDHGNYMELQLLATFDDTRVSYLSLKKHGLKGSLQGPLRITQEIGALLSSIEKAGNIEPNSRSEKIVTQTKEYTNADTTSASPISDRLGIEAEAQLTAPTKLIGEDLKNISISALKLPKRPYVMLERAGVKNLNELIDLFNSGAVLRIRGIGIGSYNVILRSIQNIIPNYEAGRKIQDLMEYSEKNKATGLESAIGISETEDTHLTKKNDDVLAPVKEVTKFSGDLFKEFIRLAEKHFGLPGNDRSKDILTKRMGLFGSKIYTLEEIGNFYGVTRERVRQLEQAGLLKLQQIVGTLPNQELSVAFSEYKNYLQGFAPLLLEADVKEAHRLVIGELEEPFSEDHVKLLMASFGFEFIENQELTTDCFTFPCWSTTGSLKKKNVNNYQKSIYQILQQTIVPISLFDLMVQVNKRHKKAVPTDDINCVLRTLENLSRVGEGKYQVSIQCLRSTADKAYRVLNERNERMIANDILREINRQMILEGSKTRVSIRTMVSQLASDQRFTSIGKRGWVLTHWGDFDSRPIVDLIIECISLNGRPSSTQEIISYVKGIQQDISEQSIKAFLAQKNHFTRTGEYEYALPEWKLKPFIPNRKVLRRQQPTKRELVRQEVLYYLNANSNRPVPLMELMAYVEKVTKANKRTLYSYISAIPEVVKEKTNKNVIVCRLLKSNLSDQEQTLKQLINKGEANTVEFKSTLRYNIKTQKNDPDIELAWIKTIAAFLNTLEGKLFVGLNDEGELLGLELDNFTSTDTLLQFVGSKIENKIGAEYVPFIKFEITEIDGSQLLVISVSKSSKPAFVKITKDEEVFYIRNGNASKTLKGTKLVDYVRNNF